MLPVLAVIVVCMFLVLHFTGVLEDLGRRTTRVGPGKMRTLNPTGHSSTDSDSDRRLKVFENFIENLTRPDEEGDNEPGSVRQDDSPKD